VKSLIRQVSKKMENNNMATALRYFSLWRLSNMAYYEQIYYSRTQNMTAGSKCCHTVREKQISFSLYSVPVLSTFSCGFHNLIVILLYRSFTTFLMDTKDRSVIICTGKLVTLFIMRFIIPRMGGGGLRTTLPSSKNALTTHANGQVQAQLHVTLQPCGFVSNGAPNCH
jgi:hypothetical protein